MNVRDAILFLIVILYSRNVVEPWCDTHRPSLNYGVYQSRNPKTSEDYKCVEKHFE